MSAFIARYTGTYRSESGKKDIAHFKGVVPRDHELVPETAPENLDVREDGRVNVAISWFIEDDAAVTDVTGAEVVEGRAYLVEGRLSPRLSKEGAPLYQEIGYKNGTKASRPEAILRDSGSLADLNEALQAGIAEGLTPTEALERARKEAGGSVTLTAV